MNARSKPVLTLSGTGSVVMSVTGLFIAIGSGSPYAARGASPAAVERAYSVAPAQTVWVGYFVETLSLGVLLAFMVLLAARLGGGRLGAMTRLFTAAYVALTVVYLCLQEAMTLRAGRGMGAQLATALNDFGDCLHVASWCLFAFLLLSSGAQAWLVGRAGLGYAAVGIAAVTLAGAALPSRDFGQWTGWLWYAWIVWAGIALRHDSATEESNTVADSPSGEHAARAGIS